MSGIVCFGAVLGLLACQPAAPPQQDADASWMTLEGRAQGTTFRIVYKDSLARNFAVAVDSLFRVID
ncbi:MAG: hypothetical protein AAGB22_05695, partial [Bacteroidota bacterium]